MNIVPFGKHKGKPVEILLNDTAYCNWLMAQNWFREQHIHIYQILVNNSGEPTETPEHNALQVKFLNNDFCGALLCASGITTSIKRRLKNKIIEHIQYLDEQGIKDLKEQQLYNSDLELLESNQTFIKVGTPSFEDRGWDVSFRIKVFGLNITKNYSFIYDIYVEIKPSLGDDYPAILRQMKNNRERVKSDVYQQNRFLLYEKFTALGATAEEVKQVFEKSGFYILTFSDIENNL